MLPKPLPIWPPFIRPVVYLILWILHWPITRFYGSYICLLFDFWLLIFDDVSDSISKFRPSRYVWSFDVRKKCQVVWWNLEPFEPILLIWTHLNSIDFNWNYGPFFDQNFTFFGEKTFENSRFDHPYLTTIFKCWKSRQIFDPSLVIRQRRLGRCICSKNSLTTRCLRVRRYDVHHHDSPRPR